MPPQARKSLDTVIKDARKKYDLRVGPMSELVEATDTITTGNIAIDDCFGVGGIPLGRSIELYGPPSSGKTTTALQAAVELQRIIKAGGDSERGIGPDDKIIYFDYEQSMDVEYAKALGLDVEHESFLFSQPDALEHGANFALDAIATGAIRMTIWDSVAAMNPEAALDAEVGASLPAIQARVMGQFLRNLNGVLANNNCSAIFINHLREKMQMGGAGPKTWGPPPTTTPGGAALKFYASVRGEYQQIQQIKGKVFDPLSNEWIERVVATNVRFKVVKNKLAPPFRQAIVRVRFGRGFDNFWTALQILVAHKHIPYSAGYFYFEKVPNLVHPDMVQQASGNHRPYIQGEQAIFEFADTHDEWRTAVIEHAAQVVATVQGAVAAITPVTEPVLDGDTDVDPVVVDVMPDPDVVVAALTERFEQQAPVEVVVAPEQLDALAPASQAGRVQFTDPTEGL